MKFILLAIFSTLLGAADLTGRWISETQGRQTVFMLKQDLAARSLWHHPLERLGENSAHGLE